jgi:MFS transporter, PPP family, 3-phenylpropionic acid transporter
VSWKPRVTFAYVAYFSGIGASFPYLPVFFLSLGLSLDAVGAIAALQAATQLLAAPVWGGLADRFPRSRLTHPAAPLLAAAGAAILVVAGGLEGALVGAVVLAAGIAGTGPVLDARVLELLGPERGRFGSFRAWGSAAFVVSATLVGIALDRLGARAMFAIYLPALLLTTAAIVSLPARPATRSVSILRGASSIVGAPRMGLFLGGVFLVLVSLTAVNAFYSIRIVTLGGGDALVGLTWAIGAMVEVPVMLGFSRLARRFGTGRLIVVGALALALRAGGAAATGDPIALLAIQTLEGFGFACFLVGGVTYLAGRAPAGLAATAQGLFAAVAGLATVVGSALGGLAAERFGISGLFAMGAVVGLVSAGVIAIALRGSTIGAATSPVVSPVTGPSSAESG